MPFKRLVPIVVGLALAAAACGGGDGERTSAASPAAQGSPPISAIGSPPSSPERAAPEAVTRPKDGRYVYIYSGAVYDRSRPQSSPRTTSRGATRTHALSTKGDVVTQTETNTENSAAFISKLRWEASRVVQLSYETRSDTGRSSCTLDPALDVLHIPMRVEAFSKQTLKGEGGCDGTRTIRVVGRAKVRDASGKLWNTWLIKIRTESNRGKTISTEDRWFSPKLGKEIRSEGITDGEVQTPQGAVTIRGQAVSLLKSYPA